VFRRIGCSQSFRSGISGMDMNLPSICGRPSEMHCAQQMIMAPDNEKNFRAREYLKVATLPAASRPLVVMLPEQRSLSTQFRNFYSNRCFIGRTAPPDPASIYLKFGIYRLDFIIDAAI
jgi:hypothetical protein